MKILTYSDLHLEYGADIRPPQDSDADLLVLAGDVCLWKDYAPLDRFLNGWQKPVLYVAGNHEYRTGNPMGEESAHFKTWLALNHPNVHFLKDEGLTLGGVHFFGGTMWTDFGGGDKEVMKIVDGSGDFHRIVTDDKKILTPADTIALHETFVKKLVAWFETPQFETPGPGARVVISHHAPVLNPRTKHGDSTITSAFNSLDMKGIIEKYQPTLWIYGHTHECDAHMVGKTRILSNQLGYPNLHKDKYECADFDKSGAPVVIGDNRHGPSLPPVFGLQPGGQ